MVKMYLYVPLKKKVTYEIKRVISVFVTPPTVNLLLLPADSTN